MYVADVAASNWCIKCINKPHCKPLRPLSLGSSSDLTGTLFVE